MVILMMAGVLLGLAAAVVLLFLAVAFFTGKGKVQPFLDENGQEIAGSVAERVYLDVNGSQNGMIIRGKSTENPVLLFISGGPGVPQYWLNDAYAEEYPNRIEDEFTVCWWDYLGEGLSFDADIQPETLTMEKLAADADAVANYLKERFHTGKIYLMAHSAGTKLGLYLAENQPENFCCYYAMGQISDNGIGRYDAGYHFMKAEFERTGQLDEIKKMEQLLEEKDGVYVKKQSGKDFLGGKWEDFLLEAGCATTREFRSDARDIFFPQMFCGCYTLSEKINYWRGVKLLGKSPYQEEMVLNDHVRKLEIPICFLSGHYDYTTPITLAHDLYENIEAPEKGFYEFADSAHSPLWEENDAVLEAMKKYVK